MFRTFCHIDGVRRISPLDRSGNLGSFIGLTGIGGDLMAIVWDPVSKKLRGINSSVRVLCVALTRCARLDYFL